jgi:RNA-directed DNA polymerase
MDIPSSTEESTPNTGGNFFSIQTKDDIARILGISEKQLAYFLHSRRRERFYNLFEVKKKNGSFRQIIAPTGTLKYIQFRLSKLLSQVYRPRASAHGFIKNKSILTNAKVHLRQKCLLNIDLKDFFPTINFGRVRGLFQAKPFNFSGEVATTLAQICCYNGALPQGAPTSPVISNMICSRLDRQLHNLARACKCRYSRYADDLTFSTYRSRLPNKIAYLSDAHKVVLGQELTQAIASNGFTINDDKTRMRSRYQSQQVTGIVVNEKLNVRREFIRQVRAMLHAWEKFGLEAAEIEFFRSDYKSSLNRDNAKFQNVVRGKIEYIGHVRGKSDPVYQRYLRKLKQLCPSAVSDKQLVKEIEFTENKSLPTPIIWTEGKTDIKHLKSALRYLQANKRFSSLNIEYGGNSAVSGNIYGDQALLSRCRVLSGSHNDNVIIAIFDRDNQNIIRDVHDETIGYKIWGNNVYSFAIPVPRHRGDLKEVCIEHYYHDGELKQLDANGRRLYLYDEFDPRSLRFKDDKRLSITQKHNNPKKIIDSDVYDEQERNVALSKDSFATYVYEQQSNFSEFSFESFAQIFEIIEKIIQLDSLDGMRR